MNFSSNRPMEYPLNEAVIRQLVDLQSTTDEDFLRSMLDSFIDERDLFYKQLSLFIENGDILAIDDAVHRFKGAADAMGMVGLSAICREELLALKSGNPPRKPSPLSFWAIPVTSSLNEWLRLSGVNMDSLK